jgi:hypothetical protein
MRIITSFFLLFISLQVFGADTIYNVVTVNGKKGLKDAQGHFVISPNYDEIGWTDGTSIPVNGVIGYQKGGNWGLINIQNHQLTSPKYTHLLPLEGYAFIASVKGKFSRQAFFGLITEKGKPLIDFKYYSLTAANGYLVAQAKVDYQFVYGLVDMTGGVVMPFQYKFIRVLTNHLIKGEISHNLFHLFRSTEGLLLVEGYSSIEVCDDNYVQIQKNQLVGILEMDGSILIEPKYESVIRDQDGTWRGKMPTKWKVLNHLYEPIDEFSSQDLSFFKQYIKLTYSKGELLLDEKMKTVMPSLVDRIVEVSGRTVLYENMGEYRIYDIKSQKPLKALKFDTAYVSGEFIYGAKLIQNKIKWALYDTFGVRRTHFDYEVINAHHDGLFVVKRRDHWGFIDRVGKEVIHCVYDEVGKFVDELCVVRYHDMYGVINKNNEWVILPQKEELEIVNSNLYLSKWGVSTKLLNMTGDLIYFTDNPINIAEHALVEVLSDGRRQMISFEGVFVNNVISQNHVYDHMKYYEDEFIAVKRNGKYGFVDKQNKLRITNRYEDVGRFDALGIPVKLLGKWGLINDQEEIVIQPIYDSIFTAINNLYIVKSQGLMGLMNRQGEELLRPEYEEIRQLENGLYSVMRNGKQGLVDSNGKWLIDSKYDELNLLDNNTVIVQKRNLYGTLTLQGVESIPNIYNKIYFHKEWQMYFTKEEGEWRSIATIKTNNE